MKPIPSPLQGPRVAFADWLRGMLGYYSVHGLARDQGIKPTELHQVMAGERRLSHRSWGILSKGFLRVRPGAVTAEQFAQGQALWLATIGTPGRKKGPNTRDADILAVYEALDALEDQIAAGCIREKVNKVLGFLPYSNPRKG